MRAVCRNRHIVHGTQVNKYNMEVSKMKCQECGKNEVNFHYSSNVNGSVTETHLCSDCAAKSGYDLSQLVNFGGIANLEQMFDISQSLGLGSVFGGINSPGNNPTGMFPVRRGFGGYTPMMIPVMRANRLFPFALQPYLGVDENQLRSRNMRSANAEREQDGNCGCGCGKSASEEKKAEVNEEMSRKRELNMQMRAAIEKEDFEKAAELRDKIRELGMQR